MILTREQKQEAIKGAFSGQHLQPWLGDDWKTARAAARGGGNGSPNGYREYTAAGVEVWTSSPWLGDEDSIEQRPPDAVITWREVKEIVDRGATPELRAAYEAAYDQWADNFKKWEPYDRYYDADRPVLTDDRRELQWLEHRIVSEEMTRTRDAILENGLEREIVQETLDFGIGG